MEISNRSAWALTVGSIPANFSQGNIQSTGVPTDVAIQGSGFLIGKNNGQQVYFRAGNLSITAKGVLVSPDGAIVQGLAAVNGAINANQAPGQLTISTGLINPPKATANSQLNMNVDSGTAVNGTFGTALTVYDSLGAAHVLTFTFTKTAANNWSYSVTIPAADVTGAAAPVVVATGTGATGLTFNGAGQLTSPAGNSIAMNIANLSDGANALPFNWNLRDAKRQRTTHPGFRSFGHLGDPAGRFFERVALVSYSMGPDGTIQGTFSNGQTQPLGQVLLATFPNNQGLDRNGSNEFLSTLASGAVTVGVPGTGGRGTISGRRDRTVQCGHLGRVRQSDSGPERLSGERESSHDTQPDYADHDQSDPVNSPADQRSRAPPDRSTGQERVRFRKTSFMRSFKF